MDINEQPESSATPVYNPISYVDDTLQHIELNPSLPSSTTYDPATSAEQVDAQSTEAHSTGAFDYQEPDPLYYEDIIDETHPLPRENDPKWRIFRFSDIEAEINGDH